MFVKTNRVRRANKTYEYLTIVESYRDEDGKVRQRTLLRLGEASALRESGELDRIIAALTDHANGHWIDAGDVAAQGAPAIGAVAAVKAWWDRLELDGLLDAAADERGLSWRLADAVFAMVANRLCDPASKRAAHRWMAESVVAPDGFSYPALEHYYRALDHVTDLKDTLETFVYSRVTDLTNLNLTLVCYDLTSTYFEGATGTSAVFPSRAFGHSRDHRRDRPQVVVGLLCTGDGIPIAHHVFAGNTADISTLPEVLEDLVDRFAVGRVCVVADRGLISENNIDVVEASGCDWLLATRLHRAPDVADVLAAAGDIDPDDERWVDVDAFDSRVCDIDHDGRRHVVVFSGARRDRDDARRAQLVAKMEADLLKLETRVKRGDLYAEADIAAAATRILSRSPMKRVFTYTAGDGRFVYDYDHHALDYEELLAGHYVLATSLDRDTVDAAGVLACYRSLQAVEVRFRVLKDFLHLRPVFHWTESRVRGHIAICVLAAVIEALAGKALVDADVADPDIDDQHLTARRAIDELDRIRKVTLDADGTTIDVVTRRTSLQTQVLNAFDVDTRDWQRPTIHN